MKESRDKGLRGLRGKALILTPLILLFLMGCASTQVIEEPVSSIVWPKPPDRPKIKFVRAISKSDDLRQSKEKSWIEKTWRFFAGETEERVFAAPYGVTADNQNNVYIADRDAREVFVFNLRTGKEYSFPIDTGIGGDYPIGIGIAENIYVSLPLSGRVLVFNKKGTLLNEIGEGADLQRATGIAVNPDKGLVYVVDTLSHNVKAFDLGGKFQFSFGKRGDNDGEFNYPTHIFADRHGKIYITDEMNYRIQAFAFDGKFLYKLGKTGMVPGTFQSPKGVAVDSDGNIYVADAMADSVQIFDKEGKLLLFFGGSGSDDGEFWSPAGLFIDKNDRLYVTDLYNRRVQIFQYLKGD